MERRSITITLDSLLLFDTGYLMGLLLLPSYGGGRGERPFRPCRGHFVLYLMEGKMGDSNKYDNIVYTHKPHK
jgi:hypothetical protein